MNIVSRHFLRRTARAREERLERCQQVLAAALKRPNPDHLASAAATLLLKDGCTVDDKLAVVRAQRGPYRWYVVREPR
jgi:hypothetical protein